MTPFRKNLEQIRDEHLRQRYAGDLAADVLDRLARNSGSATDERALLAPMRIDQPIGGTRRPWRTMFLPLAATAAIAASIAVGVTLAITHPSATDSMQTPVAVKTPNPVIGSTPPLVVATNGSEESGLKQSPAIVPNAKSAVRTNDAVANTTSAGNDAASNDMATNSRETEVATAESEEFTLVPAVASLVGENVSMDMSGQGSLDFDLSNISNDSSSTSTTKSTTPSARPAQSGSRSSRSISEERL